MDDACLIAKEFPGLIPRGGDVFDLTLGQWNGCLDRLIDRSLRNIPTSAGQDFHAANIRLNVREAGRQKAMERRRNG